MPLTLRLFACLFIGVFSLQAATTSPKPLKVKAPMYPALKVKEPIAGTAVVEFVVGVDGKATKPVVKSADDKAFGAAVIAVLPDWEFEPATVDGAPVAKKVSIPFQFKPNGKDMFNRGTGRMVFRPLEGEPIPVRSLGQGQRPKPKGRPGISYPKSKLGSGEEQRVRVKFIIGRDGKTYNPEVIDKVEQVWHLAALATVAQREFEPVKKKGKPQLVEVTFPIFFTEKPPERGGRGGGGGGGGGRGGR